MTLLTQKINRKSILIFTLALFSLANILAVFSSSFVFLMIARILPAFFHPVYWAIAFSVAAKEPTPGKVPQAIAAIMMGLNTATVIGVPLGAYSSDLFGWGAAFWLNAILNALAMWSIILLVPSIPGEDTPIKQQIKSLLQKPIVWNSLFGFLLMSSGLFASYSYLADYLEKVTHMLGNQISLFLVIFGTAGLLGNWLAGKFMSKNPNITSALSLLGLIVIHVLLFFSDSVFFVTITLLLIWGIFHTLGLSLAIIRINLTALEESTQLANSLLASFGKHRSYFRFCCWRSIAESLWSFFYYAISIFIFLT